MKLLILGILLSVQGFSATATIYSEQSDALKQPLKEYIDPKIDEKLAERTQSQFSSSSLNIVTPEEASSAVNNRTNLNPTQLVAITDDIEAKKTLSDEVNSLVQAGSGKALFEKILKTFVGLKQKNGYDDFVTNYYANQNAKLRSLLDSLPDIGVDEWKVFLLSLVDILPTGIDGGQRFDLALEFLWDEKAKVEFTSKFSTTTHTPKEKSENLFWEILEEFISAANFATKAPYTKDQVILRELSSFPLDKVPDQQWKAFLTNLLTELPQLKTIGSPPLPTTTRKLIASERVDLALKKLQALKAAHSG